MVKSDNKHPLARVGVRPAESKIHAYTRAIIMLALIAFVVWCIYAEVEETNDIDDLHEFIKKDTIMYNSLMELEPKYRSLYIKSLKSTFADSSETFYSKYYHSVLAALIAGVGSEYIISGNINKPLSGVARTVIYNTWSTIIS